MITNVHSEAADDSYVRWLGRRNDSTVFWGGGTWWREYHRCLVPASLKPQPIELTKAEAAKLLKASGALLLRYFSKTFDQPTDFWYVACDRYDFEGVSSNTRSKIRRAYKNCVVERTEATWLADHGYECYSAAFSRYRDARAESKSVFQHELLDSVGGPFDFWAVFATVVVKLHPEYLPLYSAYGLWDTILKNYVTTEGKLVTNGFRAFVHDTNVQDFLRSFGFREVYCDLKIVYKEPLGLCVRILHPFKSITDVIPDSWGRAAMRAMLAQEEIRRSFL
jgi:hypothetical protein